jgi:hypothetical protein
MAGSFEKRSGVNLKIEPRFEKFYTENYLLAGSISGTNPTATLIEKSAAFNQLLVVFQLIDKTYKLAQDTDFVQRRKRTHDWKHNPHKYAHH